MKDDEIEKHLEDSTRAMFRSRSKVRAIRDCGYPPRGPWRKRCRCDACQAKRRELNECLRARRDER